MCDKIVAVVSALVVPVAAFLVVFNYNEHVSTHMGKLD